MDYDLIRIDYTISGVTLPDTLKILPLGPKSLQKFAIGDKTGVLQCLSIRDEEPVVQFKTLPGKPITSVQLATSSGGTSDKIFAAAGNEVKGYTRKGKVFLSVETQLSETITSMYVLGSELVLGSGHIVTHYRDLREIYSYTCEDRVLDLAAFTAPNSARIRLLVLVANKTTLILEGGQSVARISIQAGPTRLSVPPTLRSTDACVFYGASDGSLGLIAYDGNELITKCLVEGRSLGPVICLGWYNTGDGAHVAVGRHDGSIQLYLVDMDSLAEQPRLKFTYFCGEPVTSVAGGCVGTEGCELVAATFSGRVFALRSRRLLSSTSLLANIPQEALNARRSKLEVEVVKLEKQVAAEREKYQRNTKALNAGISAPPLLDIECQFSGATSDGWQEATLISAVPLDMLFLYSKTRVELQTESAAVLSVCPSQASSGCDILATVRCQAGTRRLWISMRYPNDGKNIQKPSPLLVYALPAGSPRVARVLTVKLCALPLYSQHDDPVDLDNEHRTWCTMTAKGSFSTAEMTSWLADIFPGDLPKPSVTMHFARSHILLRTNLIIFYKKGHAIFKSEDISAITSLRDILTNYSVAKNQRLEFFWDIPEDCCKKHFELIENQFRSEHKKDRDDMLRKAIDSLDLRINESDGETIALCDDYQNVLKTQSQGIKSSIADIISALEGWYRDLESLSFGPDQDNEKKKCFRKYLQECEIDEIKGMFRSPPFTNKI